MVHIVKIPCDDNHQLIEEEIVPSTTNEVHGDAIPTYLLTTHTTNQGGDNNTIIDTTPLLRFDKLSAGLYAHSISTTSKLQASSTPNIRATRLAMACGCHSQRFIGDVWVGRLGYHLPDGCILTNLDLFISDIQVAAEISTDLRSSFVDAVNIMNMNIQQKNKVTEWLGNASKKNYHDGESIAALANAMSRVDVEDEDESESDESTTSDNCSSNDDDDVKDDDNQTSNTLSATLAETTLCIHCRRPASTLCMKCGGVYFCGSECIANGWSHKCVCATWKLYVQRRSLLSSFPFFSGWETLLLQEDCFASEATYQNFLISLGVMSPVSPHTQKNWWATELHGWSGGGSSSSKDVNIFRRVSYQDGFALKDFSWIPKEEHITASNIDHANAAYNKDANTTMNNNSTFIQTDENGLPILLSWEHYYRLRSLPPSSPIGLLATFPLTLYYSIQQYGNVSLTVAQMLERPLRIHIVGIEKELNFVDLFRELGFLMPESLEIDMTWIVRDDMLPQNNKNERQLSLQLTTNLKLSIVSGTYGGNDLNPDFDIKGGSPDMIIGMNAGLFAYESWRHVISYLHTHKDIVGVFTDYNEHSGMNCASLGGWKSTNSLEMNPFRQMRAMPVYCMNLPQFSNGFIYLFNKQEIE